VQVEADRLLPGQVGAAADLPQAGQAGLDEQPTAYVVLVLALTSLCSGGEGPTSDMVRPPL
jgi:hypothetical protein